MGRDADAARGLSAKNSYVRLFSDPLGQCHCFIVAAISLRLPTDGRGRTIVWEEHPMELRTGSPRTRAYPSLANACAQCGKALFMPNWSEYLNEHRMRHVWECEACGYKYETLVTFPEL
jgi:hypothetical protein